MDAIKEAEERILKKTRDEDLKTVKELCEKHGFTRRNLGKSLKRTAAEIKADKIRGQAAGRKAKAKEKEKNAKA